jgi:DNA processing protein
MELPSETRDLLALHLVAGLGPRLTKALLERFGSAAAILRAAPHELCDVPHIGSKLAADLHRAMRNSNIEAELGLIEKYGTGLLAVGTPDYPAPLAEIPDPPLLLYCRGRWEPRDANAVAIVGSRRCTRYGIRTAERLSAALAHAGFTIVSGLARGIDAAAHRGALEANGRTLAVLAGGLSRIYPPEHEELARDVEARGALLTEAPMAMEPLATMFPRRNRVISGLSRGVLVVEAADKSGALLTANHAAHQGRPVFVVPGPVDSPASRGANRLIRDGAVLVRDAGDILEELDGVRTTSSPAKADSPPEMNEIQRRAWDFVGRDTRHIDEIARHLGIAVHELAGHLMMLEMKKIVRRLPGNLYERR